MKWHYAAIATVFVIGGAGVAFGTARRSSEVARASAATIVERIAARAIVTPIDGVAQVRVTVEGRVLRVLVHEGDLVEAGQVLAEIDASTRQAEVRRREADLRAAIAQRSAVSHGARREERVALGAEADGAREELLLANDRLARQRALRTSGVATEATRVEAEQTARVADARASAAAARARLAQEGGSREDRVTSDAAVAAARAALEQAEVEASEGTVVAPIAGRVLARRIDPGDTTEVGPGSVAAFEIAEPSRSELRVELEEADAEAIELGARVEVRGPSGAVVGTAVVVRRSERIERRTIGSEDARTRADGLVRAVWARWEHATEAPLGMRYDVWLERAPRLVRVSVPRAAIAIRDGYAWVESPVLLWSRAKRVELGIADERHVEVRGLESGESVVVPSVANP